MEDIENLSGKGNLNFMKPRHPIMLFLMLKRTILTVKTYGFGKHKA